MLKTPPINLRRIEEMADGDEDFKTELISAIYASLYELENKYLEGAKLQDLETIQMIRHKIKPTLVLFDMEKLSQIMDSGKELLAKHGFNPAFSIHVDQFVEAVQEAIEEIRNYIEKSKSR